MRTVFSVLLTLTLVAGFALPRVHALPDAPSPAVPEAVLAGADVEGRGIFSVIGCVGCVGGGLVIMSGGLAMTLAAMAVEGSALAAVTCFAVCKDAIESA